MPSQFQAIKFSTPDDVYKFLAKLKADGLINYNEDSIKITGNLDTLTRNLVIATDGQTYFLKDLERLSGDDVALTGLSFAQKSAANRPISFYHNRIGVVGGMGEGNPTLIHNEPLAKALLSLNPNRAHVLNQKSVRCTDPEPEMIIPFIDTTTQTPVESSQLIDWIFSNDNLRNQKVSKNSGYTNVEVLRQERFNFFGNYIYTHFVERYLMNTALLDLQRVSHMQMKEHFIESSNSTPNLSQAVIDLIENNNQQLLEKLSALKATFDKFAAEHRTRINNRAYPLTVNELRDMNRSLATYNQSKKLDKLMDAKQRHQHGARVAAVVSLFVVPTLVSLPIAIGKGIKLAIDNAHLRDLEEDMKTQHSQSLKKFMDDQVPKVYYQVIQPCLQQIEILRQEISKRVEVPISQGTATPSNPRLVGCGLSFCVSFGSRNSALLQHTAMAAPRAEAAVSSLELPPSPRPR